MTDNSTDLPIKLQNVLTRYLNGDSVDYTELENLSNILGVTASLDDIRKIYKDNLNGDLKRIQYQARINRQDELLKNSEIDKFWDFENVDNGGDPSYDKIIDYCKSWIANFNVFEREHFKVDVSGRKQHIKPGVLLYMHGKFGVGKSMLAGAMCKKLIIEQMRDVLFMQWFSIARTITGLRSESERNDFFEKLYNIDLLVIDEVAVDNTSLSDAQRRDLGGILRCRKNNGRNTIIISNSKPENLYNCVGEYCWESIKNYEPVYLLEVCGPNRRQKTIGGFDNLNIADLKELKKH
jgi:DNA replication protein DnaC